MKILEWNVLYGTVQDILIRNDSSPDLCSERNSNSNHCVTQDEVTEKEMVTVSHQDKIENEQKQFMERKNSNKEEAEIKVENVADILDSRLALHENLSTEAGFHIPLLFLYSITHKLWVIPRVNFFMNHEENI